MILYTCKDKLKGVRKMLNYLELYQSMYQVVHQERAYGRILTIFKNEAVGRHPFITLITSEKGVKKDTIYGWDELEEAREYIQKKADNLRANEISDKLRKEERKIASQHFLEGLKVGDILCATWGYEAVWYDFYKVVGKQGSYVLLRELKKTRNFDGCSYDWASHGVVAPTDEFENDEVLKRKARDGYVSINSYASAFPWDGVAREEANWH